MSMTHETPTPLDEVYRNYAVKYFEVHSDQRLKAFQFFITLSTALIGGFLILLRYGQNHKWMAVLGGVLAFLSFVFWKLDTRTRSLVHNAEEALKYLDEQYHFPDRDGKPHPLRIVSRDDHYTTNAKKYPLWSGYFSYSRCFRWVFMAFSVVGMAAAIWSLVVFPF